MTSRGNACAGQALVPVMAVVVLLMLGVGAVTVLGAGHVSAARAQRVADLTAVSAMRLALRMSPSEPETPIAVMRQRVLRALAPVLEPDGARVESLRISTGSGDAWPPSRLTVRVSVPAPMGFRAQAVAAAAPRIEVGAAPEVATRATGGGYSGPLVHRDGKPTCPAVAAAFDLMDGAAHRDGIDLVVVSGFRSDAEQAVLFARHPDPRWVAPPGRSRHRDATELDLGVGGPAWAWLARNAGRFGFVQRYSWEPWHYGFLAGCDRAAESAAAASAGSVGAGPADGGGAGRGLWGDRIGEGPSARVTPPSAGALLAWVPAHYRDLVWRSALAGGVPPALLAALLQAESGWNPRAISPVGALGIAQFMPGTAAGMGLRDPFDPGQAVPAAARLLGVHLRRFGSVPLALAAYNAGPAAVERYGGVPPFAETQAYVARITALAGGLTTPAGALGGLRVVLVEAER